MVVFNDVVVLITGATSGIGKASAELLAELRYRVFGTSRDSNWEQNFRFRIDATRRHL